MKRTELLSRLKVQVELIEKQNLEKVPDVLCSRQDIMDITGAHTIFMAANKFFNDQEILSVIGNPERKVIILPDDDGIRVYKAPKTV